MNPLLIAAAALILGKKTVKAAEKIQLEPQGIKYDKATKKVIVTLTAVNPTNTAFTIDSLFLTVFNNGKKLGTIEKFSPFQVTKLGRSNIEFPVNISPLGLGQFIADTVIKKIPAKMELKGDLRYKGLSIPISEPIDFSLT